MSHGSYTSLDSLAQNGIIDFDANSYLTGAPARYVGKPYSENYLPFQQPLMSLDSYGTMPPPMGYQGGGLGPMNGYQGPWTSVRPSHHAGQAQHYRPTMHTQPHNDQFTTLQGHKEKSSAKKWLAGIAVGVLGFIGLTKIINKNYDKKVKAVKAATAAAAKAAAPKTKAELKAEAKAAKKAAYEAFKNDEVAKGTSKFGIFFKKIGYKLKNAPKWLKITGIAVGVVASGLGILTNRAKKQFAAQQAQIQQAQQEQAPPSTVATPPQH